MAVEWTAERRTVFKAARAALGKATNLAYPRMGADLGLMVDASADHVGAALQHCTGPSAGWQPLGFFSKKLDQTQQHYSAYNRELLACVLGIRHFKFMLEGRPFTLYTDHKPLTHALAKAVEPKMARQSRHLSYLAEFTSDIRHISGVDNVMADTLSRPPAGEINAVAATLVQVDYEAIAEAQRTFPETAAASITSTTLQQIQFGGTQLICDTSGPPPRPMIPAAHRQQLFTAFHSLTHPGTTVTG